MSGYQEIWQEKPDLEKLPKGDVNCHRAILLDKRLVALPRDFNGVKEVGGGGKEEEEEEEVAWNCIRVKAAV